MQLVYRPYELLFVHPFGVSSNTRTSTTSVFIRLSSNGVQGFGEACLPVYLGEDLASCTEFLQKCAAVLKKFNGSEAIPDIMQALDDLDENNNAAKAAIDIALHDLHAKMLNVPVYEMLGLPRLPPQNTSFTIALDSADKLAQKIIEADDYAILKIKAGTADDKKLIRQIRKITYKPLYVDVNQGWRDKHMVIDMLSWMKEQGVLLVEQPMPLGMDEEMAWVTEKSPLPVIADERVKRLTDLQNIKGVYSGINIKLMKSTGIYEALQMIDLAKKLELKIMLGCMSESSCGTAAMSHLLAHADFIDLDAPVLYRNDPFGGQLYQHGKIQTPATSGIGICAPAQFFPE